MADNFLLTSGAFQPGGAIPVRFTCDGDNLSPPLAWHNPPDGTRSFALVVDDPDAPRKTFVHWVLFNLSPDQGMLPEGLDVEEQFGHAVQPPLEGVNDFGGLGYGGPCPPPTHGPHHYSFRLYALDTMLDLGAGATRQQLSQAMDRHILAEANLLATYRRGG